MKKTCNAATAAKWLAAGVGVAAGAYAAYVATTWVRYGRPQPPTPAEDDSLLNAFMPDAEVATRHHIAVGAPAAVAFATACTADMQSPLIAAIFKMREMIFGKPTHQIAMPPGFAEALKAIGWEVLAEVPGREIVFGTVTQPWRNDAVFRAVPANEFAAFSDPGYVKIALTLRADPVDENSCTVRTETRVATTSPDARARFRWYWAFLSPGIRVIRVAMLSQVKRMAEDEAAELWVTV